MLIKSLLYMSNCTLSVVLHIISLNFCVTTSISISIKPSLYTVFKDKKASTKSRLVYQEAEPLDS